MGYANREQVIYLWKQGNTLRIHVTHALRRAFSSRADKKMEKATQHRPRITPARAEWLSQPVI